VLAFGKDITLSKWSLVSARTSAWRNEFCFVWRYHFKVLVHVFC